MTVFVSYEIISLVMIWVHLPLACRSLGGLILAGIARDGVCCVAIEVICCLSC